jgi:hypothetical protein
MLQICEENKEKVLTEIRKGRADAAEVSAPNLIDAIIRKTHVMGITEKFRNFVEDKRKRNRQIPLDIIMTLSVAAKMKQHTSLTDIPYAITDARTLAELGYAMWDSERSLEAGLFDEGTLRNLLGKYQANEFVEGYNRCVQEHILPHAGITADVHILDCTKLDVKLENANYEGSSVITDEDGKRRGYKLASLRGLNGDGGIIEEIRLGTMKEHDLTLSLDILLKSPVLKPGDVLINDRGFLSREVLNELKTKRQVDTYIPLRRGMDAYEQAVSLAKEAGKWASHPNRKRKGQLIAFVEGLGDMWRSNRPEEDVPINGCVVWDTKTDAMFVFVTTDLSVKAKRIIQTYEIRPEIEEEYRQLKDFWQMDDLKSTKLHMNAFHIICTLLGYLLFQLYVATREGEKWAHHSLPVIVKKYTEENAPKSIIVYVGQYFGIFAFLEFIQFYASLPADLRASLDVTLALV